MTDYDQYLTNGDKPFAENFNDAILLSNMFDLNVDIDLPEMYANSTWSVSSGNRKAGVAITNVKEATGLSVTSVDDQSAITGTGTLKLGFYPNFNAFGGIEKISWTGTGTITCSIYSAGGSLITDVNNGETISSTTTLRTLQNFEIRLTLSSATLKTVKVGMVNKDHTRYGAKISISDISGLQDDLDAKVNVSDIKDNLTSTDTNKPLSANQGKTLKTAIDAIKTNDSDWVNGTPSYIDGGTMKGMIRNGFAIVFLSSTNRYVTPIVDGNELFSLPEAFHPVDSVEFPAKLFLTGTGKEEIGSIIVTERGPFTGFVYKGFDIVQGEGIVATMVYPIKHY